LTRLFGTQGFRGIVNKELTSTVAHDIGLASAGFWGTQKTIGLGWDTRKSSDMIGFAFSAGLMSGGCNVYLVGLVPTPLLSYAIPHLNLDGGAMITASHNPPEYNGIKLWGPDGASFTPEMELKVEANYFAKERSQSTWQSCGHLAPVEDFRLRYIEDLLDRVDKHRLIQHKFRVAADCGGGTATMVMPILLNAIDTQSELLFCEPDGHFSNRLPEPKESNLTQLIDIMKNNDLDIGMAWDGDADRITLVTNQGRFLSGDRVFALAAFHTLRDLQEKPKRIVTQVATSDIIHDIASTVDAEVIETRVGEPYVVSKMKEVNAAVGGEENGGVIYRGWSWTREGILTALILLELMATEDKSLDELDRQFPSYHQVKDSFTCSHQEKESLLTHVSKSAPTDAEINNIDGVKLRFSDGWVLLRPSGTEPLFRIFAEAKTETRAKTLAAKGRKLVKEAAKEIKKE
jgi:phosphomannomutase/phosphoglucomutase